MLKLASLALFGLLLPSAFALSQDSQPVAQSSAVAVQPSPAELRIAAARQQITKDPKHTEAYTDLALAYIRRARETADPAFYQNADFALTTGLRLAPGDFQLERASVALLLGRRQFPEALAKAIQLNKKNPDDVTVYGYMAEADIALGKYADANTAAQWMLNMRPNNIPGLLIGADLRVVYGDVPGALDFLNQAFGETPQIEAEELSYIANRMAEIELGSGQTGRAAQALARAEELFPHSPLTLENLKRLRLAENKSGQPVDTAQQQPAASVAMTKKPIPAMAPPTPSIALALAKDGGELPQRFLIPRPTGTDRIIKKMQSQIEAHPQDPAGYTGLGAAFFQRARETGDVEDYNLAEQALDKSLDMISTDLTADAPLETMAEVCMGEHRFTDALEYAQKALALGSGDLSAFAIVGDAYADMGEYEKASIAYSRLQPLTTQPGTHESYGQQTRTAYLTFVSGDTAGAIAQMHTAVSEALSAHLPSENLAWLYFELGEFSYQAGAIQAAGDAYLTALTVYPGDYRALAGLGKVRANQGRYAQAITLYQSAIAVVPMPIYIAELGDIYAKTGNAADAEKQYKLVEYIGRLGHINQVLHNRDLALFYADHDRNLDESLTLARKEFEVRSDIYTWDALAWALYKNGRFKEADEAMAHALRLGTRDATLFFHAGMISAKAGKPGLAVEQLDTAMKINPRFHPHFAEVASQELSALHKQTATSLNTAAALTQPSKNDHVE